MTRQDRIAIMAAIIQAGREVASAIHLATGVEGEYEETVGDRACDIDHEVQKLEALLQDAAADE